VDITQGAAANAQHHRPVPMHQHLKGRLVLAAEKQAKQLSVGLLAEPLVSGEFADVPDNCPKLRHGHRFLSPQKPAFSTV
jgi:hypothetical protein